MNPENEEYLDQRERFRDDLPYRLRDGNYTSRITKLEPNTSINIPNTGLNFEQLRLMAETQLKKILEDRMGELETAELEKRIGELETALEKEKKEEKRNINAIKNLEDNLNLLKDLNKVMGLSTITIPNEDGTPAQYCILRDSAGGVTEKHSLIKLDDAITPLLNLCNDQTNNASDYLRYRENYKLSTQGILKLPKHGKTTEVQREAIALNISRILGFTTTESTMVEHNGKAALFIPFDKIQLLNEFADGEVQHIVLPSSFNGLSKIGDEYLHYSTIVPVGNRLNREQMIEDFGHVMAFSYLCNDTDFIGMNNQNKAIKDNNQLYMFDQVVMSHEKMSFDTRLNLVPIGMGRHSRHNQGRNRSIIEDSSFDSKFNSITHLIERKNDINSMLKEILANHDSKLSQINNEMSQINPKATSFFLKDDPDLIRLKNQLKEVELLKNDLIAVHKTINQRMETLFTHFPTLNSKKMNSEIFYNNQSVLKGCLILEKLVNKPVLFTDDGRPYRNPWTYRNTNKINSIDIEGHEARIRFNALDPIQIHDILNHAGIEINKDTQQGNTLIIPVSELDKIKENSLFPELRPFDMDTNYLDPEHLKRSLSGYQDENQRILIARVMDYQNQIYKKQNNSAQVVNVMNSIMHDLHFFSQNAKKGMVKQVELNLQFDMHQRLRTIILKEYPTLGDKLNAAFQASVKLDHLNEINNVLKRHVQCECINPDLLVEYLDKCIEHGENAVNYKHAKVEAQTMHRESLKLSDDFKSNYEVIKTTTENNIYKNAAINSSEKHQINNPSVSRGSWENIDASQLRDNRETMETGLFKSFKERLGSITTPSSRRKEPEAEPTALVVKH